MKKVFIIISVLFLISENGNCQWYQRQFGVNDLNQLSQEQLNMALKKAKGGVATGITFSVIGAIGIVSGIHLFTKDYPDDEYPDQAEMGKQFEGLGLALISIPPEIIGLVILKKKRSRIAEIEKVLNNPEIKIGLFNCPSRGVFSHPAGYISSGFSIIWRF